MSSNIVEFPVVDRPITEGQIDKLHSEAFRDLEGRIDILQGADDPFDRRVGAVCAKDARIIDQDGVRADLMIRDRFQFPQDGSVRLSSCGDVAAVVTVQPEDARGVDCAQ